MIMNTKFMECEALKEVASYLTTHDNLLYNIGYGGGMVVRQGKN